MPFHLPAILLLMMLVVMSTTRAEEPATQPASQPTALGERAVISPGDKETLDANMGKDVIIEGVIDSADWSDTGKVLRARFKDSGNTRFLAVIFAQHRKKFDDAYNGDVSKTLTGATVRLKGKLKEYRGAPEIVLDDVSQITIVEPTAAE